MMKRVAVALLVLVLLVVGALLWVRAPGMNDGVAANPAGLRQAVDDSWFGRFAARLRGANDKDLYSGYVEADYVYVTSVIGGTLTELAVTRGVNVTAGAPLFHLDDDSERAVRDESKARLAQAEHQLTDLLTGKRPPEIEAIEAQRVQARAALRQSESEFERQIRLRASGTSSEKQLEDARSQRDRDAARIIELDAQLRVARMPGRDAEIRAAESAVTAAKAALAQADWRLTQKTVAAPTAGFVVDTLYRPGEMVQAGQAVVQLLPAANIKIRFFVPQAVVAQIAVGQKIQVSCDGCGAPIAATVRFISPQTEFTPPVIYSREQRSRLVFMIEARPDERATALRVGQPLDVKVLPQ
jgi:HlyD family secretion protein